ncbi:LacI family DNA-binding transcriptional regulator [Planotetraspora silvatica]|nr:LacI family DNA-binding transcriptional regulator [Planotetraspora silvatica]
MADVAKLAGVSPQTVSRVLNDHPRVCAETRARVVLAIERLGYRRNLTARALVTRHSRRLGVVSFDATRYGRAGIVFAIEQAARERGYSVSIVNLRTLDRAGIDAAVGHLAEQGVEGVVIIGPRSSATGAFGGLPEGTPAVVVEGWGTGGVPVVGVDQVEGAMLATGHLLELGHETVWHVAGPAGWLEADGRVQGWRAALRAAGRQVPDVLIGDWSPRSGYQAGKLLMTLPGRVTAVFVANDQMALGVLRALAEAGVPVPGQVSVVGFDDIAESEFFSPPLTTVRQDFAAVARDSVDVLLAQIESDGPAERERLAVTPQLIVRGSAAVMFDAFQEGRRPPNAVSSRVGENSAEDAEVVGA